MAGRRDSFSCSSLRRQVQGRGDEEADKEGGGTQSIRHATVAVHLSSPVHLHQLFGPWRRGEGTGERSDGKQGGGAKQGAKRRLEQRTTYPHD